ncbi:hypothetical protein B0H17DRAFT_1125522 [Mycena rosella]|uniref:Uncharacterized protein n=1 Tax=Mycena rosella TaxID=1033263 RepID=A0AAD7GWE1_MYCRO|nr:hypothetical protein B0H17DRAFT_1125522 [Mycena rosella]
MADIETVQESPPQSQFDVGLPGTRDTAEERAEKEKGEMWLSLESRREDVRAFCSTRRYIKRLAHAVPKFEWSDEKVVQRRRCSGARRHSFGFERVSNGATRKWEGDGYVHENQVLLEVGLGRQRGSMRIESTGNRSSSGIRAASSGIGELRLLLSSSDEFGVRGAVLMF